MKYSQHAKERMYERNLSPANVMAVMMHGEKSTTKDRKLKKSLAGINVIYSYWKNEWLIITTYEDSELKPKRHKKKHHNNFKDSKQRKLMRAHYK